MTKIKFGRIQPWFLILVLILTCRPAYSQNWNPSHRIVTQSGGVHYSNQQIPSTLVALEPALLSGSGVTFRWESSTDPLFEVIEVVGTGEFYSFSEPVTETKYFRRITTYTTNNSSITSNTVKIHLVSMNWEDRNYVREHDVRISGQATWQAVDALPIGDKLQATTYMDGLGRSVQQISKGTATPVQANGTWGDMVQFSEYDEFGREPRKYLPYTTTTEAGKFKTTPQTAQAQYYTTTYNETPAFSKIEFEKSPLNRVKNIKAPGSEWAASIGNCAAYETNTIDDNVQLYVASYVKGDAPVHKGAYLPGSLYKSVSKDENGNKVIEFTDKTGQLILRKVELEETHLTAHGGWICTYSIYDDFGQLRFQLQPEAVKFLEPNGWSFAVTNGDKVLKELCFQYYYDEKGRNTWKKAPGAEPLIMVYDNRDRLVFTQDGNQRLKTNPEWTATLYDELDRPVITTIYQTDKPLEILQADIAAAAAASVTTTSQVSSQTNNLVLPYREAGVTSYTAGQSIEFTNGFESETGAEFVAEIVATGPTTTLTVAVYKNPISDADLNNASVCTILKYQFYDNYSFIAKKNFQTGFENGAAYSFSQTDIQPVTPTNRTLGFPTGSRVRVLGTTTFLNATAYFDDRGAPIQQLADNQLSGTDVTTLQYHFDGRVMSSFKRHSSANTAYGGFGVLTKNVFDKLGRVTAIHKKWGTNPFQAVAEYSYDDMGRLKTKRLAPGYTQEGKSELESLTYSYNLHNLITGINKDYALKTPATYNKWDHFFGLYLGYDNKDGVFSKAKLNGQVTGLLWNTQGDDAQRKYDYTYDHASRLLEAQFNEKKKTTDAWSHAKMDFTVTGAGGKIGYDLNGNLTSMIQTGVQVGGSAPINIDDLQYSYASFSNKLMKVTDAGQLGANNGKMGDFKDGTNSDDDYDYDANGNLVIDKNKGAKDLGNTVGANGIRYNFLDKPEEVRIAGKGTITFQYDAEGSKLRKTFVPESGGSTVITTYVSGYVYQETVTGGQSSGVKLQYFAFEEGRIRPMQAINQSNGYDFLTMDGNLDLPDGKRGALDFYIRDYQENVRMILTQETHIGSNQATMETARASTEEPLFGQSGSGNEVVATRFAVNNIPGQLTGGGWQNPNIGSQVSRIGALAAKKVGPNALLKVMGGDRISSQAEYYYQSAVTNGTSSTLLSSVLGSLINSISGSPVVSTGAKEGTSGINSNLNNSQPFKDAVSPDGTNPNGTSPKAYLNILFFDERFEFVQEGSTAVRVQGSGSGQAALNLLNIRAPKNGYCYVYLSNESDEPVYFDNFKVTHNRGRIVEENHYYAYGLKIAALSSKKVGDINEGHLKNNYLFQGDFNEFDEDLGWNQFALRDYDSQIGRFVQQDPYQQYATPYTGMGNDPVNLIDPSGGVSIPSGLGQALNFAKEGGTMAEVIITFTRVTSSVSSPLSTISIVSTTLSLLNSTLQGSTLISGKMAAGAVGGNAGLDDFILVNTKSKTVQVTKTDDPYDVVQIDGQKRYQDYRKGITEEKYRKLGYQVRPGPEGVGMGAVDGAILTFVGAKFTNWLFKGAGRLWGRLAGRSTPALRAAYEAEVRGLASIAKKMKVAGKSSEDIARYLHQLRRELGIKYKSLTPKDLLQKIYQRNLEKYGDKLGPTIDYLRQQGKSWDDIIESATRPGGKDIKF